MNMKKSTQNMKKLMLTAVASLLGLSANAQYSQTVTQFVNNGYAGVLASFKLTDVAETLDTDTATLANALQTWYDANVSESKENWSGEAMFQAYVGENKLYPEDATGYNSNFNGMWIGRDGEPHSSKDGGYWHAESKWSVADNTFSINLYQMPDSMIGGESIKKMFALSYNGKTATFDLTYNIEAPLVIPTPATLSRSDMDEKMTKVGEKTFDVVRTDVQGYEGTKLYFDAAEMAKLFGEDLHIFKSADLSKMVYTIKYDTDNNGIAADTLTNKATAGSPGFWFTPTLYPQGHEQQGEASNLLGSYTYGSQDKFFIETFKFVGDSIECNLGQYPNQVKAGENYEAHVYFILGDKYYQANYNISCIAAEGKKLAEMTKVGNLNVNLEYNQYQPDKEVRYEDIDLKPIMEVLGVADSTEIKFGVLKDEESLYPGKTDAGNYGFWLDEDSHKVNSKDAATSPVFVTLEKEGHPEKIGAGLYNGLQKETDSQYKAVAYYYTDDKYFTITIHCKVVAIERPAQSQWEIVETREVNKLVKAETGYFSNKNQSAYSLTAADCQEILGTANPMLYCTLADSLQTEKEFMAPYTANSYLCGPAPGVWLGTEGQGHKHTGNAEAPVGISWLKADENGMKAGDFFVFQAPNVWKVGDTYKTTLYLVNEENFKMIKLNFNITFVEAVNTSETVGKETVNVIASPDGDMSFTLDLSKAAKALGVSEEDLVDDGNDYFKVKSVSGTFSGNAIPSAGYTFGMNGEYDASDNGDFGIQYNPEGNNWLVYINNTLDSEKWTVNTAICFEKNGKQYIYEIVVMDEETFTTGIDHVKMASQKNGKIYNLQGVEVKAPIKGHVYIQNGKKIIK